MKTKAKGFTVLELILTLAITTMVLGAIYTFFFTSNKSLMTTDINSTLQMEGEVIQKELIFCGTQADKLLEVNGVILDEEDINYNLLPSSKKLKITNNIKFEVEGVEVSFNINGTKLTLTEKSGADIKSKELSQNVEAFEVRPIDVRINEGGSFKTAPGLEFTIVLHKKKGYSDVSYPISAIVKFRNK